MDAKDHTSGITLRALAGAIAPQVPAEVVGTDEHVSDVHMDSRAVTPDSLYVAIRGAHVDGHDFIDSALAKGASALVLEERMPTDAPYLLVEDTRQALGWIAAAVHGNPGDALAIAGITGTNGKTTVAHMMAAMTAATTRATAVIGTVGANLEGVAVSPRTTPEASELQRIFRHLADGGKITDVAVEVSSHALVMGRVNGTGFDVVAFTNLSQDHLDYHHTMEEYFQAKASLFDRKRAPRGVVWIDDPWGRRLAEQSPIPVVTVGTDGTADVRISYLADHTSGSTFEITIESERFEVTNALAGRFNVANAAVAITLGNVLGWDTEQSIAGLAAMGPIPGRYNTLPTANDLWVVVDYAHTPDAISLIIEESGKLTNGKIIAVAGAGGDRDHEKRPLMGQAVANADVAIVTTDNPRSEDPNEIIKEVISRLDEHTNVVVEPDRRLAIRHALRVAEDGDVVLILGKGHETGQEFADRVEPFDDTQVAREELDRIAGLAQ